MLNLISRAVAVAVATTAVSLALAPMVQAAPPPEPFRRLEPTCLLDNEVQSTMRSYGYRDPRIVGQDGVNKVVLIATNGTGTYQFLFNRCTREIEDRQAL